MAIYLSICKIRPPEYLERNAIQVLYLFACSGFSYYSSTFKILPQLQDRLNVILINKVETWEKQEKDVLVK